MKTNLRRTFILAAVILMAIAAPTLFTARADRDDDTTYRARLSAGRVTIPGSQVSWRG